MAASSAGAKTSQVIYDHIIMVPNLQKTFSHFIFYFIFPLGISILHVHFYPVAFAFAGAVGCVSFALAKVPCAAGGCECGFATEHHHHV